MAHQKQNDDKGYIRGARGIDDNDGSDFVHWGKPEGICKVMASDGGNLPTRSPDALIKSAKGK